jgi:hypothetical protein
MADGLLVTRKERIRFFWLRFPGGVGPALVGFVVASSARTVSGAFVGGLVVAGLLIAFQIVVAWFFTHPILPGS